MVYLYIVGISGVGINKAFLRVMGLEVGNPRLPLASVPDDLIDRIKKDFTAAGLSDYIAK